MSTMRKTKTPINVRISEKRLRQIQHLVDSWSYESRGFVLQRLRQFRPKRTPWRFFRDLFKSLLWPTERRFQMLRNPEALSDWHRRFEISGSSSAGAAWNKILNRELNWHEYHYLTYLLERETTDIFVPPSLHDFFEKLYRAHILKEYTQDPNIPRAPLVLIIGPSGSGKSATITQTLEETIFSNEVRPTIDLKAKKEEVLKDQPIWKSLEDVDPELAVEIERMRRIEQLKFLSRIPILKYLYRKRVAEALYSLGESGIFVDYAVVTPNDYQTAFAGEPGNRLRKAMGEPNQTCIRHLEEAHSAFGRPDPASTIKSQQGTLIDTANILFDEITQGKRDLLLIATTDQPEQIEQSIYRRFVERGKVIDISDYWQDTNNLKEVVRLEMRRNNYFLHLSSEQDKELIDKLAQETVDRMANIFRNRSLRITPAYVRRLIDSVITLKGDFKASYLDDQFLVRDAFKSVAKNVYGGLYNRVSGRMGRDVHWQDYIGSIKDEFSEMANNSLYYNVQDEKGVVLTGPPGSGKTYMVKAWLGENAEIQDLAVHVNDLSDPNNPYESMVENLERVYDIAKMISPCLVFFDEGDAIAPRRSQQGGSPYDKVTNKFLSIIDGESPLNHVFTVLTTNRLDILDPALIRSKRLKVLNVPGQLREEDAVRILRKELDGMPLDDGLSYEDMVRVARGLCDTPADFTAFAEKVRSLHKTEVEILGKLKTALQGTLEERLRFVRFNAKTLFSLMEAITSGSDLFARARRNEEEMLSCLDEIAVEMDKNQAEKIYPITHRHLVNAKIQLAHSPTRKGKQQLDKFLETELSKEPQVGFVVGVGANDTSGVLLPIASSLVYQIFPEKIVVTGAVSSASPAAAEIDLAVQMTRQSAQEALTLVENYLQSLCPELNVSRILGQYLQGYSLHHQLLSTSYTVGGPSAGFALAINTLSVLVNLPVLNDFGITGAPWIKGADKGEVGASVIIGGHRRKTEKVLQYLPRMYMPMQNYEDLEPELLKAYRIEGKDIRGVRSFSGLVREVFYFGPDYQQRLQQYKKERLEFDLKEGTEAEEVFLQDRFAETEEAMRGESEDYIRQRMRRIAEFVGGDTQPLNYTNLERIFDGLGAAAR
ncbi:MAG: AAA family ATPase [Deltaproteobacteria bacterium]|nr:AAA family ATPase [Deltaproteobacteria bacterium]